MASLLEALRQVPYFAVLDDPVLREVIRSVREVKYEAGEAVVLEGEPCKGLYVVVSGRVKVYKVNADGKEQVIKLLGAGRTCNDVPVFDDGVNPASVETLEASHLALVPKARMRTLVEQHPRMATAVIRLLAGRLRALTLLVEDLSLRGVAARVAKLLLDCTRGQSTLAEGGICCQHLTQQQIATMTGSVREVVQRALKALEKEGAIRMERARIVVLDAKTLERWSGSEL